MNKTSKIYIAGHRGLVGSAIVKSLTYVRVIQTSKEKLLNQTLSINGCHYQIMKSIKQRMVFI